LIQQKDILGVVGFFDNSNMLRPVGLTCAVCHSKVDNSVGTRIDGLTNRDLNIGSIAASAPNLQPVVESITSERPGT